MAKKKFIKQSKAKLAFRKGQSSQIFPLSTLIDLRKNISIGEYKDCINQFCIFGNVDATNLFSLGQAKPENLVFQYSNLDPLPLKNELHWAVNWLSLQTEAINIYVATRNTIQNLILKDQFEQARDTLDSFTANYGWSFWGIEIRCVLEQTVNGMAGLTEWLTPLKVAAGNRLNGLIYEILSDRCEETFSFYAFYAKCRNSFPRLKNLGFWVIPYLEYRALAQVNYTEETLPIILSKEITSSLIDYYEIVVDSLVYISVDKNLIHLKPTAKIVILKLIECGIKDSRLNKLLNLFIDSEEVDFILDDCIEDNFLKSLNFSSNESIENDNTFKYMIIDLFKECEIHGNTAQTQIDKLIKLGICYKNLDIGQVIINAACHFVNSSIGYNQSPNLFIFNEKFKIEDITSFSFEEGIKILKRHIINNDNEIIRNIINLEDGNFEDFKVSKNVLFLWLAKYLYSTEQYGNLDKLLSELDKFGGFWSREVAKFKASILNTKGQVIEAIDLINNWLIENPRYIREFDVTNIFENRKWRFFKELDFIKVGLISHHSYQATDIAGIGYICKMACRSILESGMRDNINSIFNDNIDIQDEIIHFFANVWIDENLSLCTKFDTTEKVRQERIGILQLLLQWDAKKASIYTDEIKDLTFDQTIQKGLRQIDQTRVFVNESAITRWAESEILPDYKRWMTLKDSSSGTRIIDDIISQFAVDANNRQLLLDISDGQPNISSALLIEIVDRLYKRFLNDPTDGLDCYLSLRIRHGSLRGTVFGPLEENRLLYFPSDISKEEFQKIWGSIVDFNIVNIEEVLFFLEEFSKKIKLLVDELINELIQIHSIEKPRGAFKDNLSPEFLRIISSLIEESNLSFSAFLANCYFLFWKIVELALKDLNSYIANDFKDKIKHEFDELIDKLRSLNNRSALLSMITTLQSVSTDTQIQCDMIADWFRNPAHVDDEDFQLPDAIDIAQAATQNVYRTLDAKFRHENTIKIPLTTSALAVLTDCLFVIFENAWKYSGLGSDLEYIDIETQYNEANKLLTFTVYSDLSEDRKLVLNAYEIQRLKEKYIRTLPIHLVNREGGSGFAKLARLVRFVNRAQCPEPFNFGIKDSRWFVEVTVPLFEREGRFEAYE
ncbi:hypothetical protein [Acinetobacter baumannii]|uniref:hypothetical protein n=1 Tax=Acinetobacter baumannii TaxID=470 RepID=UPI0024469BFF|nr:hypothetical protein [Acinetobacter baumannii]MDH2518608.1 hypothetical protein [Acinetobacter baumannii]